MGWSEVFDSAAGVNSAVISPEVGANSRVLALMLCPSFVFIFS